MAEFHELSRSDLHAKAEAERTFGYVDELRKRILRGAKPESIDELTVQLWQRVQNIRLIIFGKEGKKLSPVVARHITGQYMYRASQVEEALVKNEWKGSDLSAQARSFGEAVFAASEDYKMAAAIGSNRILHSLESIDEQRGQPMDRAWSVFFFETGISYSANDKNPDLDEAYGQAMIEKSTIFRKMALPWVVYQAVDEAAAEGATPMPDKEAFMVHRDRARNALEELIQIWEPAYLPIADKYRAMLATLDREILTLSLYYRSKSQQ